MPMAVAPIRMLKNGTKPALRKNVMPRLAWSSVSAAGSDGSMADTPSLGEVKVEPLPCNLVETALPELGMSGVL